MTFKKYKAIGAGGFWLNKFGYSITLRYYVCDIGYFNVVFKFTKRGSHV